MNKNVVLNTVLSATAGAIIGGAITYTVVNKKLKTRYEDWANAEINEVKNRYVDQRESFMNMFVPTDIDQPESSEEDEAVRNFTEELMEDLGYSKTSEEDEDDEDFDTSGEGEPVRDPDERERNIFDMASPEDSVGEPLDEDSDKPYRITANEFMETEDYEQDTLIYYAGDDTLADQNDSIIPQTSVDMTIGRVNLSSLKKTPGDEKDSIYIRNNFHKSVYEVILNESSYSWTVLRMGDESLGLKEPKKRINRMRDDD